MSEVWRWVAFAAGVVLACGTVVAVMKTLIVPRRSWSLLSATIGRIGYRVFYGTARRMRRFDHADRFLGFEAPTVVIVTLTSLLMAFTLAFGLMLLPWADITIGDALRESGSSVFTLGFLLSPGSTATAIDVAAAATGMIFVALTIGYLPALFAEVRHRDALVKQLEAWAGKPPWGPEILARMTLADAVGRLPRLFASWDAWCARVADSHMKYPVLTHFRGPRARNHFMAALLAVADAAALAIAVRPSADHTDAQLMLRQACGCVRDVAYPIRRIDTSSTEINVSFEDFAEALRRLEAAGFPMECDATDAWPRFVELRRTYAPIACQILYWTIAAPSPWSGDRYGFPDLTDRPAAMVEWSLV